MPKVPTDIKSLARAHSETAIAVLYGVMRARKAPHASRVAAATALLDRGWGKPEQAVTGPDGDRLEVIIRHIVDNPQLSEDEPEMIDVTPNSPSE